MSNTPSEAEPVPSKQELPPLTLEQTLLLGIHFHKQGRVAEAEEAYRAVIAGEPGNVNAMHFLGVLLHQAGNSDEGIGFVQKAVTLCPEYVDAQSNLGNLLRSNGRMDEALAAYQKALAIQPNHPQALNNLGVALKDLRKYDEAIDAYRQAIASDGTRGDSHFNLANLLSVKNHHAEAEKEYRLAIELQPSLLHAYEALTRLLQNMGRDCDAVEVVQTLVSRVPESPVARHLHAAMTGRDIPPQAPDGYVQHLFDTFAGTFDVVLERLNYQAPNLVAAVLKAQIPEAAKHLTILDAGCGTGLCGPLLKPWANRLIGVDLSNVMLVQARKRALYDELHQCELTQFIERREKAFDVIVSADTLVYFGNIGPVTMASARALRPGGILTFTLEAAGKEANSNNFHLQQNGRYQHREDYVRSVIASAGLTLCSLTREFLRKEKGQPVMGLLVVARVLT